MTKTKNIKNSQEFFINKCSHLNENWRDKVEYFLSHRDYAISIIGGLYFFVYGICILTQGPTWLRKLNDPDLADVISNTNSMNEIFGAIFSITMVIVGFIFTELKSKAFVAFGFLTRKTFIFPIFYSSLINIGLMLLTSHYYSLFGCTDMEEPCYNISNIAMLNLYMVIINMGLIVFLFRRVVKYMDSKQVIKDFRHHFLNHSNKILMAELINNFKRASLSKGSDFASVSFEREMLKVKLDDFNKVLTDIKIELRNSCKEDNYIQSAEILEILENMYQNIFKTNECINEIKN